MEEKGVAAGRVYRAPDMLADPQFAARDAIVEVPHPVFGAVRMQNAFPKLTDTPGAVRWPGPALGEHTDAVLIARAGLSADDVVALRGRGIV
jgi:formyl-CoA transferase